MIPTRGVGPFARHQRANVSVVFAGCIFFIMSIIGFAIDLGMHRSAHAHVQVALDASGLAAMKSYIADPNISNDDLQLKAQKYFDEHIEQLTYASLNSLTMTRTGHTAVLEVTGEMPTSIMHLFGKDSMGLYSKSEVTFRDSQRVELALVLDASHSMTGSRLTTLKAAATRMVDELIDPSSNRIQMSIVPFSGFVNVGTAHSDASHWLSIEPDRTESSTSVTCIINDDWAAANCPTISYECGRDGATQTCTRPNCNGISVPDDEQTCTSRTVTQSLTWHGCVRSRPDPHYQTDTLYATHKVPGIVTPNAETCAPEMQTLTNDDVMLRSAINNLEARGETYIPAGLVWGWRTLTNPLPFTQGAPTAAFVNSGNIKVVILMSDGENSISALSDGRHEGHDQDDADALTEAICTRIKQSKMEIYTIAFDVTDIATREMLEDCASTTANYYEAKNTSQLTDAFESIRHQLESALAISG
ncbi:MAG: Tad domain-containing protein [Pseudomonadota bacterium]